MLLRFMFSGKGYRVFRDYFVRGFEEILEIWLVRFYNEKDYFLKFSDGEWCFVGYIIIDFFF